MDEVEVEVAATGRSSAVDAGDETFTWGEVCTLTMHKADAGAVVGLEVGASRNGKWLVVTAVRGGLASVFTELKPVAPRAHRTPNLLIRLHRVLMAVQPDGVRLVPWEQGAKLVEIETGGQRLVRRLADGGVLTPSVADVATLILRSTGDLKITIVPLLDRFGFIMSFAVRAGSLLP